MKIARAVLTRVRLKMREPVATARGPIASREGAVLALASESGLVGHGEALPLAGFGEPSPERNFEALSSLARALLGREVEELDALLDRVEQLAPQAPFARAALDVALFDLAARARGTNVAALLAGEARPRARVALNALVHAEAPARAARESRAAIAAGYRTVKLKVGVLGLETDASRVAAVRDAIGGAPGIRLDANGGWKEREAEQAIARFSKYRIELLEQPVEARDLAALARISAGSPIPIAADEALAGGRAVDAILARRAASALILKPAALGGLRASQRIAARARASGLAVVVSSALDSALGLAAALQLAAALPGPQLAAGLATGGLFERDLAKAPEPRDGALHVPAAPGVGVAPSREGLARCALGPSEEIGA